jgi:Arc/MetJ-type ribon-helix-helix transcriptional regulator
MSSASTSFSIPETMKDEIDVLVESGEYTSRSDVMRDAFRTFLRKNPEKRIRITVELYKNGKVSLMRAAELAETDLESYKEELRERGITLKTRTGSEEGKEEVEKRL